MTADADASARSARRGRSPFELLRFSATPVPGALVVVEIEGRVATASGRFARRPVLVVEPAADGPRLELAPSRATLDGDRWQAAYAIPAEAYDAARFALGLRGTLLDLPAPDEPSAADRQTLLAREANTLRRQLEAAEAASASARAEATAAAGELGAAVSAARDEALAESAERISDLEQEVAESQRLAASDAAELRTAHEAALGENDRAQQEAAARHDAALAEALAAHEVEIAALRSANEAALAAKDRALEQEAAAHDAEVAQLRGATREQPQDQEQRRRAADGEARALAAEEGIGVLRAELAEERERSQGRIGELELELEAATSRLEALRRAAESDAPEDDETRVLRRTGDEDPERTQVLAAVPDEDVEETRPMAASEDRVLPLERGALPRQEEARGPGAYVAVGALVVFVVVLLALLGFL